MALQQARGPRRITLHDRLQNLDVLLDGLRSAASRRKIAVPDGTCHQIERFADTQKYRILRCRNQGQMEGLIIVSQIAAIAEGSCVIVQ